MLNTITEKDIKETIKRAVSHHTIGDGTSLIADPHRKELH